MVRSDRLAGPVAAPVGLGVVLFTVPAGETWLVKRVCTTNGGPAAGIVFWSTVVTGVIGVLYAVQVPAVWADDHETWWALDPGAELRVDPLAAGCTVTCFGAKLLGTA